MAVLCFSNAVRSKLTYDARSSIAMLQLVYTVYITYCLRPLLLDLAMFLFLPLVQIIGNVDSHQEARFVPNSLADRII